MAGQLVVLLLSFKEMIVFQNNECYVHHNFTSFSRLRTEDQLSKC
jgi:hypothetical protein